MVFTNIINPRSHINRRKEYVKTLIKYGATIGANATIICGNNIGKYALVGAGSGYQTSSRLCTCCWKSCKTNWLGQ